MRLGVNIDHIATLREARKIHDPNPLEAVFILQNAGASQVTLHLREDRRHIHDEDLIAICKSSPLPINLECATSPDIISLACKLAPHRITLVPEKREEITTEGGLNLSSPSLPKTIDTLKKCGIQISLFIDPCLDCVEQAKALGADCVELHTGEWSNLFLMLYSNLPHTHNAIPSLQYDRPTLTHKLNQTLNQLKLSAESASKLGLEVYAGHGLNYQNVLPITEIKEITELNIGHSIIARSIFVGLFNATKEMLHLIQK